jgi:2-amino-4-hydroxy-6-hydroxymethyldihydropteridine diphosphokinase
MTDAPPVTAYLALGSNLGDRAAIIQSAIDSIRCAPGIELIRISSIIETEPQGLKDQPRYLNGAVEIQTRLSPAHLLQSCLAIEQAHGRDRKQGERWGPRILDIDILLYGSEIVDETGPPRLRIPHPHLAERVFVLVPLAEIAPNAVYPESKLPIRELLQQLTKVGETEYKSHSACF